MAVNLQLRQIAAGGGGGQVHGKPLLNMPSTFVFARYVSGHYKWPYISWPEFFLFELKNGEEFEGGRQNTFIQFK